MKAVGITRGSRSAAGVTIPSVDLPTGRPDVDAVLREHGLILAVHSQRKATTGSTAVARRAGM